MKKKVEASQANMMNQALQKMLTEIEKKKNIINENELVKVKEKLRSLEQKNEYLIEILNHIDNYTDEIMKLDLDVLVAKSGN